MGGATIAVEEGTDRALDGADAAVASADGSATSAADEDVAAAKLGFQDVQGDHLTILL